MANTDKTEEDKKIPSPEKPHELEKPEEHHDNTNATDALSKGSGLNTAQATRAIVDGNAKKDVPQQFDGKNPISIAGKLQDADVQAKPMPPSTASTIEGGSLGDVHLSRAGASSVAGTDSQQLQKVLNSTEPKPGASSDINAQAKDLYGTPEHIESQQTVAKTQETDLQTGITRTEVKATDEKTDDTRQRGDVTDALTLDTRKLVVATDGQTSDTKAAVVATNGKTEVTGAEVVLTNAKTAGALNDGVATDKKSDTTIGVGAQTEIKVADKEVLAQGTVAAAQHTRDENKVTAEKTARNNRETNDNIVLAAVVKKDSKDTQTVADLTKAVSKAVQELAVDTQLIASDTTNRANSVLTRSDATKQDLVKNGIKTSKDGVTTYTSQDGKSTYSENANDHSSVITNADGTSVSSRVNADNGHIIRTVDDGDKSSMKIVTGDDGQLRATVITNSDGSSVTNRFGNTIVSNGDGTSVTNFEGGGRLTNNGDGSKMLEVNGTIRIENTNGSVVAEDKNGKVITNANGTSRYLYTDGSWRTNNYNGSYMMGHQRHWECHNQNHSWQSYDQDSHGRETRETNNGDNSGEKTTTIPGGVVVEHTVTNSDTSSVQQKRDEKTGVSTEDVKNADNSSVHTEKTPLNLLIFQKILNVDLSSISLTVDQTGGNQTKHVDCGDHSSKTTVSDPAGTVLNQHIQNSSGSSIDVATNPANGEKTTSIDNGDKSKETITTDNKGNLLAKFTYNSSGSNIKEQVDQTNGSHIRVVDNGDHSSDKLVTGISGQVQSHDVINSSGSSVHDSIDEKTGMHTHLVDNGDKSFDKRTTDSQGAEISHVVHNSNDTSLRVDTDKSSGTRTERYDNADKSFDKSVIDSSGNTINHEVRNSNGSGITTDKDPSSGRTTEMVQNIDKSSERTTTDIAGNVSHEVRNSNGTTIKSDTDAQTHTRTEVVTNTDKSSETNVTDSAGNQLSHDVMNSSGSSLHQTFDPTTKNVTETVNNSDHSSEKTTVDASGNRISQTTINSDGSSVTRSTDVLTGDKTQTISNVDRSSETIVKDVAGGTLAKSFVEAAESGSKVSPEGAKIAPADSNAAHVVSPVDAPGSVSAGPLTREAVVPHGDGQELTHSANASNLETSTPAISQKSSMGTAGDAGAGQTNKTAASESASNKAATPGAADALSSTTRNTQAVNKAADDQPGAKTADLMASSKLSNESGIAGGVHELSAKPSNVTQGSLAAEQVDRSAKVVHTALSDSTSSTQNKNDAAATAAASVAAAAASHIVGTDARGNGVGTPGNVGADLARQAAEPAKNADRSSGNSAVNPPSIPNTEMRFSVPYAVAPVSTLNATTELALKTFNTTQAAGQAAVESSAKQATAAQETSLAQAALLTNTKLLDTTLTKTSEKTSTEKTSENAQHLIQIGSDAAKDVATTMMAAVSASVAVSQPSYSRGNPGGGGGDAQAGRIQIKTNPNKQGQLARATTQGSAEAKDSNTCVIRNINGENQYIPISEAKNLAVGETSFTGQFTAIIGPDGKAFNTPQGMMKVKPLTQEDIEAATKHGGGGDDLMDGVARGITSSDEIKPFALPNAGSLASEGLVGTVIKSGSSIGGAGVPSTQRDVPRDVSHELPRDASHEVPRDVSRNVSHELPRDVSRELPRDASHALSREISRDLTHDAPRSQTESKFDGSMLSQSAATQELSKFSAAESTSESLLHGVSTKEAADGSYVETIFAADGRTAVAQSNFDRDGNQTSETDFKADGITPETITNLRLDGSVASLTSFGDNGKAASVTQFLEDGITPSTLTNFRDDGKTPLSTSTFNRDGSLASEIRFGGDGVTPEKFSRFGADEKTTDFATMIDSVSTIANQRNDGKTPTDRTSFELDGSASMFRFDEKGNATDTALFLPDSRLSTLTEFGLDGTPTNTINFGKWGVTSSITEYDSAGKVNNTISFNKDASVSSISKYGIDGKTLSSESVFGTDRLLSMLTQYSAGGKATATTAFGKDGLVDSVTRYGADSSMARSVTNFKNGAPVLHTIFSEDGSRAISQTAYHENGSEKTTAHSGMPQSEHVEHSANHAIEIAKSATKIGSDVGMQAGSKHTQQKAESATVKGSNLSQQFAQIKQQVSATVLSSHTAISRTTAGGAAHDTTQPSPAQAKPPMPANIPAEHHKDVVPATPAPQSSWFSRLKAGAQNLGSAITGEAEHALKSAENTVINTAGTVASEVKHVAAPLVAEVKKEASSVAAEVKHVAAPVVAEVKKEASSVVAEVKHAAAPTVAEVKKEASSVAAEIKHVATPIAAEVKKDAASVASEIKHVAAPVVAEVKKDVGSVEAEVKHVAAPLVAEVKKDVSSVGTEIKQVAAPLVTEVKQAANNFGAEVKQVASTTVDAALKDAGGFASNAGNLLSKAELGITRAAGTVSQDLVQAEHRVSDLASRGADAIDAGLKKAEGTVNSALLKTAESISNEASKIADTTPPSKKDASQAQVTRVSDTSATTLTIVTPPTPATTTPDPVAVSTPAKPQRWLSSFSSKLSGAFSTVVGDVESVGSSAIHAVSTTASAVETKVVEVAKSVGTEAESAFAGVEAKVIKATASVTSEAGTLLGDVVGAVKKVGTEAGDLVSAAEKKVVDTSASVASGASTLLGDVVGAVKKVGTEAGDLVSAAEKKVVDSTSSAASEAGTLFGEVVGAVKKVGTEAGDLVTAAEKKVVDSTSSVASEAGTLFGEVVGAVKKVGTEAGDLVTAAEKKVVDGTSSVASEAGTLFGEVVGAVKKVGTEAGDLVSAAEKKVVDSTAVVAAEAGSLFGDVVGAVKKVGTEAGELLAVAEKKVVDTSSSVTSEAGTLLGDVVGVVKKIGTEAEDLLTATEKKVVDTGTAAASGAGSFLGGLFEEAKKVGEEAGSMLLSAEHTVVDATKAAAGEVGTIATSLVGGTSLGSVFSTIEDKVIAGAKAAEDVVTTFAGTVLAGAENLETKVIHAGSELVGAVGSGIAAAEQTGASAGNSLWDGLSSLGSSVASTVEGYVNSTIDAAKNVIQSTGLGPSASIVDMASRAMTNIESGATLLASGAQAVIGAIETAWSGAKSNSLAIGGSTYSVSDGGSGTNQRTDSGSTGGILASVEKVGAGVIAGIEAVGSGIISTVEGFGSKVINGIESSSTKNVDYTNSSLSISAGAGAVSGPPSSSSIAAGVNAGENLHSMAEPISNVANFSSVALGKSLSLAGNQLGEVSAGKASTSEVTATHNSASVVSPTTLSNPAPIANSHTDGSASSLAQANSVDNIGAAGKMAADTTQKSVAKLAADSLTLNSSNSVLPANSSISTSKVADAGISTSTANYADSQVPKSTQTQASTSSEITAPGTSKSTPSSNEVSSALSSSADRLQVPGTPVHVGDSASSTASTSASLSLPSAAPLSLPPAAAILPVNSNTLDNPISAVSQQVVSNQYMIAANASVVSSVAASESAALAAKSLTPVNNLSSADKLMPITAPATSKPGAESSHAHVDQQIDLSAERAEEEAREISAQEAMSHLSAGSSSRTRGGDSIAGAGADTRSFSRNNNNPNAGSDPTGLAQANHSMAESMTMVIRQMSGSNHFVPIEEASHLSLGEPAYIGQFVTNFEADGTATNTPQGMLRIKPLTQEEIDAASKSGARSGRFTGATSEALNVGSSADASVDRNERSESFTREPFTQTTPAPHPVHAPKIDSLHSEKSAGHNFALGTASDTANPAVTPAKSHNRATSGVRNANSENADRSSHPQDSEPETSTRNAFVSERSATEEGTENTSFNPKAESKVSLERVPTRLQGEAERVIEKTSFAPHAKAEGTPERSSIGARAEAEGAVDRAAIGARAAAENAIESPRAAMESPRAETEGNNESASIPQRAEVERAIERSNDGRNSLFAAERNANGSDHAQQSFAENKMNHADARESQNAAASSEAHASFAGAKGQGEVTASTQNVELKGAAGVANVDVEGQTSISKPSNAGSFLPSALSSAFESVSSAFNSLPDGVKSAGAMAAGVASGVIVTGIAGPVAGFTVGRAVDNALAPSKDRAKSETGQDADSNNSSSAEKTTDKSEVTAKTEDKANTTALEGNTTKANTETSNANTDTTKALSDTTKANADTTKALADTTKANADATDTTNVIFNTTKSHSATTKNAATDTDKAQSDIGIGNSVLADSGLFKNIPGMGTIAAETMRHGSPDGFDTTATETTRHGSPDRVDTTDKTDTTTNRDGSSSSLFDSARGGFLGNPLGGEGSSTKTEVDTSGSSMGGRIGSPVEGGGKRSGDDRGTFPGNIDRNGNDRGTFPGNVDRSGDDRGTFPGNTDRSGAERGSFPDKANLPGDDRGPFPGNFNPAGDAHGAVSRFPSNDGPMGDRPLPDNDGPFGQRPFPIEVQDGKKNRGPISIDGPSGAEPSRIDHFPSGGNGSLFDLPTGRIDSTTGIFTGGRAIDDSRILDPNNSNHVGSFEPAAIKDELDRLGTQIFERPFPSAEGGINSDKANSLERLTDILMAVSSSASSDLVNISGEHHFELTEQIAQLTIEAIQVSMPGSHDLIDTIGDILNPTLQDLMGQGPVGREIQNPLEFFQDLVSGQKGERSDLSAMSGDGPNEHGQTRIDLVGESMLSEIVGFLSQAPSSDDVVNRSQTQIAEIADSLFQSTNISDIIKSIQNGEPVDFNPDFASSEHKHFRHEGEQGLSQFDPNDPDGMGSGSGAHHSAHSGHHNSDPANMLDEITAAGQDASQWLLAAADDLNTIFDGSDEIDEHGHHRLRHDPYATNHHHYGDPASDDPQSLQWNDPVVDPFIAQLSGEDPYHKHQGWLHEQKEMEFDLHHRRELEEAKARAEEQAKEYAAAMILALKQAAQRENAELQQQQDSPAQREMRKKYIVLPGDTLESIAQKMLQNKDFAPLIYEINRSLIQVVVSEGKRKLLLKPRTIIFMPTSIEIRRFRMRMSGKNQAFDYAPGTANANVKKEPGFNILNMLDNLGARSSGLSHEPANVVNIAERRRNNIQNVLGKLQETPVEEESDGRIVYTCRLGDTLRSIALRHPALKDVTLWKLIAQINQLSTEIDDKGIPIEILSRNTTLKLPSVHDVQEFKSRARRRNAASATTQAATPPVDTVQLPDAPLKMDAEMRLPDNDGDYVPEIDDLLKKLNVPVQTEETDKYYSKLAERCRISRSGEVRGTTVPYMVGLEVRLNNGAWLPIVTYEITPDRSWRYEATLSGGRKSKQINLPIRHAKQMAENDITKNWRQYAKNHNISIG